MKKKKNLTIKKSPKALLDLEDRRLAEQAKQTLKQIEAGKEKTIPWEKAKTFP